MGAWSTTSMRKSTPRPCTHRPVDVVAGRAHPWSYDYISGRPERFVSLHNREPRSVFRYVRSRHRVEDRFRFEVVKIGPHVHAAEFANMQVVHGEGLPVPRPIKFVPRTAAGSEVILGNVPFPETYHNYILMEFVDGSHLDGDSSDRKDAAMARDLLGFIKRLQSIRLAAPNGRRFEYHFPIQHELVYASVQPGFDVNNHFVYRHHESRESLKLARMQYFMLHSSAHVNHAKLAQDFGSCLWPLVMEDLAPREAFAATSKLDHTLQHLMPRYARAVVTHGFLNRKNILHQDDTGKIVAVLDWSAAGVYPCY